MKELSSSLLNPRKQWHLENCVLNELSRAGIQQKPAMNLYIFEDFCPPSSQLFEDKLYSALGNFSLNSMHAHLRSLFKKEEEKRRGFRVMLVMDNKEIN